MTLVYRYAGPDGEAIPALPAGCGAAIGSEYCAHLLPGPEAMRRALAASRDRGSPLILLTPYLRDAELKRALPLFRTIPDGADVTVAVNDWGALLALRLLFPRLDLSIGRLLSGQKRCPRIGVSGRLTPEGRRWHGLGLFSSRRAVAHLRDAFSVTGYHVDRLDWGPDPSAGADGDAAGGAPAGGPDGEGAPRIYVHGPPAIVTVSDACPWIGGLSSSAVPSCARSCRDGMVMLEEPSMGAGMLQRGKARFAAGGASPEVRPGGDGGPRIVLYDAAP